MSSLGIMYTFAAYCILSYQSSEYSDKWYSMKINPILLIITGLLGISLFSWIVVNSGQYFPSRFALKIANEGQYIPIREAIVIVCMWLMNKEKFTREKQEHTYEEAPHQEQHSGTFYMAEHLVNIGLSHIGRKTKTQNPYITPKQTEERQKIERPFLKLLADNYKDEATRKTLAQYFMLYKEMILFVIFAMTLKQNPALYTEVKGRLRERLSEGLSPEAIKKRNCYWRELSRALYESGRRTQSLGSVLEDVFWGKLPKKVNSIEKCGHDSLYAIFCYIRKAVERRASA